MEDVPASVPIDWAQLVRTYQRGPASESGPLLIAALTGRLKARARKIPPAPPVIGHDDIWQALCLEALAAAAMLKLPENPGRIPRMLVQQAGRIVARGVVRELRLSTDDVGPDEQASAAREIGERPPLFGRSSSGDPEAVLLLHQRHVLGMGYGILAASAAANPEAVRQRVSRARRRLQETIWQSGELESRCSNAPRTRI